MFADLYPRLLASSDITDADLALLRELSPRMAPAFPGIIDDFYRRAQMEPVTRRVLKNADMIARLRQSFLEWLHDLFERPRDPSYVERRLAIGRNHVEVGLPPIFVFSAMGPVRMALETAVLALPELPAETRRRACRAIHVTLDLDLGLISGSYHEVEKYRDLVDTSPDMIGYCDSAGRIFEANRTLYERLGIRRAELVQKTLVELSSPESSPQVALLLRGVFDGQRTRAEFRLHAADGEALDVEAIAIPHSDPVTRTIDPGRIYLRDITERRRIARDLLEKQSLVRLGEMAAVVAHEVKNPLAGISGALRVIEESLPPGNPHGPIIEEIVARLLALNETVDDLLLYARPRRPLPILTDLSILIGEAVELIRRDSQFDGIRIGVDAPSMVAAVDPEMLKPVIYNLLVNAAQALVGIFRSGQDPEIRITLGKQDRLILIDVDDSGPGIPQEHRDQVFEPFFTTKRSGNGLGLSIAYRVVQLHGGRIEVLDSELGGARLRLTLPEDGPPS